MAEGQTLKTTDTKQTREEFKNKAVETREQGKLEEALAMFEQVIEWDKKNKNLKGQMDVLGHIRIVYTRMADEALKDNPRLAKELRYKAVDAITQATKIGTKDSEFDDQRAIQKVHLASATYDLVGYVADKSEKQKLLNKAYSSIKSAMKSLPGSKAHLAWPSNTKAKIEYELGLKEKAIQTLTKAEELLYEGYEDEFKQGDQAEIKFAVWLSGLHLTLATIAQKEHKPLIARHYATSVVMTLDPNGILGERKKEAQRILDTISAEK